MLTDPLLQTALCPAYQQTDRTVPTRRSRGPQKSQPEFIPSHACTGTCSANAASVFDEKYGRQPGERFQKVPGPGQAGDHHLRGDARLPAAHAEPNGSARADHGRRRVPCQALRQGTAAGHLAAGVRLLRGARTSPARGRHPLLLHRHPRRLPRRAAAQVRRVCADLLPLRRGRFRPGHRVVQAGLELRRRLPGDYNYRDFYRDVGFDLDYDYVQTLPPSRRHPREPGHQVLQDHRHTDHKDPYIRHRALEKAAEHAGNFCSTARSRSSGSPASSTTGSRSSSPPTTPSFTATGGSRGRTGSTSCSARPPTTREPCA